MVESGALYRTWRPRSFDDVVGQRHVVQTLRNAIRRGTLGHAYLFAGPRGTGKTSMARILFKSANCLAPVDGSSCERCASCVAANEGRAIDLVELDAASNRGIDDIRELRDKIYYAPAEARYRVYILDEAHQLTQPAWDALLKTLEEPPPHAILVLATTEAHRVPATVLSRCQRFDFHRLAAADIRDRLTLIAEREGIAVDPTVLTWIARAARGGLRDAIGLLDQLRAFAGDRIDAESARQVLGLAGLETVRPFLEALRDAQAADAVAELGAASERGVDPRIYIADVLTYLRALLLLRYGAGAGLRNELPAEEIEWLESQTVEWEAGRLHELVAGLGEAVARFRDPAQLVLQAELLVLAQAAAPRPPAARVPGASSQEPPQAATPGPPRAGISTPPDDASPASTSSESRPDESGAACSLAELRERWPTLRDHIANNSFKLLWFNTCEIHDAEGDTLILKAEGGFRAWIDDRECRREIERRLSEALSRSVRVRFIDDAPVRDGSAANEDPVASDPVVQRAVKLFGGPLVPVEADPQADPAQR